MKKRITLEHEKRSVNEEWDRYLSNLTKENYDRSVMLFYMQKMDIMDYRLIQEKRHDLLG